MSSASGTSSLEHAGVIAGRCSTLGRGIEIAADILDFLGDLRARFCALVPLNAMCSSTCEMPCSTGSSQRVPAPTQMPSEALSSCGMASVTTVIPLSSLVISVLTLKLLRGPGNARKRSARQLPCPQASTSKRSLRVGKISSTTRASPGERRSAFSTASGNFAGWAVPSATERRFARSSLRATATPTARMRIEQIAGFPDESRGWSRAFPLHRRGRHRTSARMVFERLARDREAARLRELAHDFLRPHSHRGRATSNNSRSKLDET